jgi:putative ABC transport system permease protein
MIAGAPLVLSLSSHSLPAGFAALFMLVVGLTLMAPLAVAGMVAAAVPVAGRLFGVQVRLAIRGIGASLSRTGVAIAALMLAVATTVGVGIMVGSFRITVQDWLGATLQADVYVSAPRLDSGAGRQPLDPALVARVRGLDGVSDVSTGRAVTLESSDGLVEVFVLQTRRTPRYLLKAGDADAVWDAFLGDRGVVVSEPLAYRRGLVPGASVELRTDQGPRAFTVAGVYYDYDSGPGTVLMHRALYDRYWRDRAVGAMGLYLADAADPAAVMARVRAAADQQGEAVLVVSNREVRDNALAIFDRTFAITNVLRMLAVLVAFVGILSAFMALQLERARELGVLRATGATPGQVGLMVAVQTGFMGLAAGVLSLPVGWALSKMLIDVINRRAFGWTMQTHVPADVLLQALVLAVVAALAAGVYPGWRMARTSPAAALREE